MDTSGGRLGPPKAVFDNSTGRFLGGFGSQMESKMEPKIKLKACTNKFCEDSHFEVPIRFFAGGHASGARTEMRTPPNEAFCGEGAGTILGRRTTTHALLTSIQGVGGYIHIRINVVLNQSIFLYVTVTFS